MRTGPFGKSGLNFMDILGHFLGTRYLKKALNYLKKNSGDKTLTDLGSGFNAKFSKKYWNLFSNIQLFDLDLNHELISNKCKIFFGDLNDTFNKPSVLKSDFIILNNVLEHLYLRESENLLFSVYENLKPSGVTFISVPSKLGKSFFEFFSFKLKMINYDEIDDHKRYYSTHILFESLTNVGFRPSHIKVFTSKLGLTKSAIAVNCTKPRCLLSRHSL